MIDGSGTINTVVGSGVNGFSGDGAAATGAMINNPAGLFLNSDIIYFADAGNNRIRTVSTTNIINTIAGVDRYIGDGGPATAADLLTPQQLCIDKAGNLYFTETNGNRVRKISPSGIITTLAGNGIGTSAGDGGPATAASLYLPEAIDVDTAGNVYIGEFNGIIRKVTPAGIISTIAGNGTLGFCGDGGPALSACLGTQSLTVGQAGNMYLSEGGFARVRHIDASGIINSIAGIGVPGYSGDGGAATDAQLSYPLGIQADGMGNIYIADHGNSVIRKIDAAGDITTVAGNGTGAYGGDGGPATAASLYHAACIKLIAHGNMLIADGWNNRIRLLTADGNISTIAGTGAYGYSGDGGNPLAAELWLPTGITIDTAGNIYFVDGGTYVIRKISNWTPPIGVGVSSPTAQNIKAIVSPNPATNYIDITAIKTITSLSITNVLGQQVLTNTTCNDTHLHLNIEHLSPGTYFIRINGNETIKFLKQ